MDQTIFIGRNAELTKLSNLLAETRNGLGKLVFIKSEAGGGKTALIQEFLKIHAQNCQIFISECRKEEENNAYSLFSRILNTETNEPGFLNKFWEVAQEVGPEWVEQIPVAGPFIKQTIKTVQSTQKIFGHSSENSIQIKGTEDIWQLYEDELRRLSHKTPIIIFLDDIHWADSSSLSLLFALGKSLRAKPFPMLLICSYRHEEIKIDRQQITSEGNYVPIRHPLKDKLNELRGYTRKESHIKRTDEWMVEILVPKFEPAEIDEIIKRKYPNNEFPKSFVQKLEKLTKGNPLFVTELLSCLQERKVIDLHQDGYYYFKKDVSNELPKSIEGVISERIERLSENLKKILDCASVNGEDFAVQIIKQVLQMDELKLLEYLSDLSKKHSLIVAERTQSIKDILLEIYQFTHTLIWKYVYQSIDPPIRRYLHQKMAEALQIVYGKEIETQPDLKEQYFHHLNIAKGLIDADTLQLVQLTLEEKPDLETIIKAGSNELKTAKRNFQKYAMSESLTSCYKTLTLLKQWNEMIPEILEIEFEAYLRIFRIQIWMGHYHDAYESATTMLDIATSQNRKDNISLTHYYLGIASMYKGDYDKSNEHFKQASVIGEELKDQVMIVRSYLGLGDIMLAKRNIEGAVKYYQQALIISVKIKDQVRIARSYHSLGEALLAKKDYDTALKYINQELAISKMLKEHDRVARGYHSLGKVSFAKKDYDSAIENYKLALAISEELQDQVRIARNCLGLGEAMLAKRDYDGAIEYIQRALAISEELQDQVRIARSYRGLGKIFFAKKEYGKAIENYKEALIIHEKLKDLINMAADYKNLGKVFDAKKDYNKATECYKKASAIQ